MKSRNEGRLELFLALMGAAIITFFLMSIGTCLMNFFGFSDYFGLQKALQGVDNNPIFLFLLWLFVCIPATIIIEFLDHGLGFPLGIYKEQNTDMETKE